jgi:uncharacterized protein YbaR (Trm112 family)
MIRITCTSCQKPLSLDETKLPAKEVSFPCPVCKTKLSVDRRKFEGAEAAAVPAIAKVDDGDGDDPEDNEFGEKALIVGNDSPALRQAAKLIGFLPVYMATAEKAREYFNQEAPHVVLLHPAQITPPPLEAMQPIISLTPQDRRKCFMILISDNLRTLDGNAAFLYGVNLVVAPKDLGAFPQIYRDAMAAHDRMYSPMMAVQKLQTTG